LGPRGGHYRVKKGGVQLKAVQKKVLERTIRKKQLKVRPQTTEPGTKTKRRINRKGTGETWREKVKKKNQRP